MYIDIKEKSNNKNFLTGMKKNIINLVLLVFVFISIISIPTRVQALTAADVAMLQTAGIISAAQANDLNDKINMSSAIEDVIFSTNSSCANITTDIGYRSKDADSVSVLQGFLNKNGYLAVTPTGYFGTLTLSAVKAFQSANGINTTGYVGPLTRAKIQNIDCNNVNTTTIPSSTISPISNKTDSFAPVIVLNANPTQVSSGQPTTLAWSTNNAASQCKITSKDSAGNIFSSTIDSSGFKSSGPINKETTYTVICYNKYGIPGTKSVLVKMVSAIISTTTQQQNFIQAAMISSLNPSTGNRGGIVTIKGTGFLSTNDVVFDGLKIDNSLVLSQSSTSISFKIPEYQVCSVSSCPLFKVDTNIETGGKKIIQVSNTNGFSNDFTFTILSKIITVSATPNIASYSSKLAISSIKPLSGNRGDTATISGSGFSSDSIVLFGGFKVADSLIISKSNNSISFTIPPFQMGCTEPDYEICPRLPISGSGIIIETGGTKTVSVMNTSSKATSTSVEFTLPSKKITY